MAKTFRESEVVQRIASGLIPNHHPEIADARIMYVFVDKASSKGGREVWGKAQKLSGFSEWALDHDFVIFVAEDKWVELNQDQQTALVDHLLERCTSEVDDDGEVKWKVREPDTQEFAIILDRHGIWHDGLKSFVEVAKAVDLDALAESEGEVDLASDLVSTDTLN
jgi:hypothetical protein